MTIDPTAIIDVKVRDIMTERVITIESSRTVKEAVDKMVEKDIECLPVIRDEVLCGLSYHFQRHHNKSHIHEKEHI